jgi:hypothetical protein
MPWRYRLIVLLCILCSGCARAHYQRTHAGTLKGKLVVEWMEPDLFLFRRDPKDPLTFTRSDGTRIEPQAMLTDGGSIPRPMWVFRNYSPWGYGPAFVIHDWLFHVENCQLAGYDSWTLDGAATVMSEVMKTLMENPKFKYGDQISMYSMYLAVRSPPARAAWEHGKCLEPPSDSADYWRPSLKFVVQY